MLDHLIDLVYPRRCPICGDIVTPRGSLACLSCSHKLKLIAPPKCKKCGKHVDFEEQEYCFDCVKKQHKYSYGISLWEYDSLMRKSISDFKYKSRKEYADFYIEEFVKNYINEIIIMAPDVLVPIPIHKSKLLDRGYNQAEILCQGLSSKLGIPTIPNLLKRDKKTLPQKQLNDKERFKNLQKAFSFNNKVMDRYNKPIDKVLLVDDIYTTGSTIEACTRILLSNGISNVYFASICVGKGF